MSYAGLEGNGIMESFGLSSIISLRNTFWCQKPGFFFPSSNTLPHNNLCQVLSGEVGGGSFKAYFNPSHSLTPHCFRLVMINVIMSNDIYSWNV